MAITGVHPERAVTAQGRSSYTQSVKRSSGVDASEPRDIFEPRAKPDNVHNNLLSDYKTQADSLGTLIANIGFGVILATSEGQIIYANDVAETLIHLRRGLCSQRGRILATDVKINQRLQLLISAACLPIKETLSSGSIILPDKDGDELFAIHVAPVAQKTSGRVVFQERFIAGLFIADRNQDAAERVHIFGQMFGLTPAETRVLTGLISGKGLASAARRLKITELTARTHLKHIMAKTDTHRQVELMRLFFEMTIPSEGWRRRPSIAHRPTTLPNTARRKSFDTPLTAIGSRVEL